MKKTNLLSIAVNTGSYSTITQDILNTAKTGKSAYTCVANVHMLVEAYRDKNFAKVVSEADITTPDGKPITWALRLLYKQKQDRVAGMDLLPDLIKGAEAQNLSVYFFGGTQAMLEQTKEYLQVHHPQLIVAGLCSPPFRQLTPAEEEAMVQQINNSGAQLVFVALGCPKQEKWMAAMKGRIKACMVGIGGALPVMIGQQKRAPLWMQDYGLEWAYRLSQEPKRLFSRYAVTNSVFVWLLCREYITQAFDRTPSAGSNITYQ